MRKIYKWYSKLTKRVKDSIIITMSSIGVISTILSVLGLSLADIETLTIWLRIVISVFAFIVLYIIIYMLIGRIFRESVSTTIRQTSVSVVCGDIFEVPEFRVIGCDTNFRTEVDDVIISKKSLHGQLILNHGVPDEINAVIEKEAKRLGLHKNDEGLYDFPLGTIIRYDSSVDNHTYLMLAMTKLNSNYESHTNMSEFEYMLMGMWKEINRVYAGNDIALPLLGSGISRFDDGPKEYGVLLRCMLCTLNGSGVTFNSNLKILIYGNIKDIPLYEYKDIFNIVQRR